MRSAPAAHEPLERLLADHRPGVVLARLGHEPVAELIVDRVEDDDPAGGGAALAGVRERRCERPATALSRSASSQTTSAFLPPSSRQTFARRRARGLVDPAPGRRRAREGDEVDVRMLDERGACLGAETLHHVQHPVPAARPRDTVVAKACADAGVCSDGFSTQALPQRMAGKTFQATFGSGVLNEIRSPATPSGWRTGHHRPVLHRRRRRPPVEAAAFAGDEEAHLDRGVRLAARGVERLARLGRDDLGQLLALLAQGERDLAAHVAARTRPSAPPTPAAHAAPPRLPPSTSSAPDRATRQSSEPSAGRRLSSHSPDAAGTSLPSTWFGTCSGITRPTSRRRRPGWRRSCTTMRPRRGRRSRPAPRAPRPSVRAGRAPCTPRGTPRAGRSNTPASVSVFTRTPSFAQYVAR